MNLEFEKYFQDIQKKIEKIENDDKGFLKEDERIIIIEKKETKNIFIEKFNQKNELKKKLKNNEKPLIVLKDESNIWIDPSLSDWPENDYRIMVQNLGVSVRNEDLKRAFSNYKSLAKVHVVKDSSGRAKQYGFVSLLDKNDYIEAMTKLNNTFIGKKRIILKPSKWKDRVLPNNL